MTDNKLNDFLKTLETEVANNVVEDWQTISEQLVRIIGLDCNLTEVISYCNYYRTLKRHGRNPLH